MEDAAEELRVGMTTLKGLCRKYGVKRWPQRKLGSLDKLIADMRRKVAGDPSLMAKVQELEAERWVTGGGCAAVLLCCCAAVLLCCCAAVLL